jgi:DNA repair protein RecO (recombination protein O)
MRSSFLISRGRNLHLITQAEVIDPFDSLRADLPGIGQGSYIVELVDAVTYEEGSNLNLYDLLVTTLNALDSGQDQTIITHYFELHLLGLVGFQPEFFICVECGKTITEQDQYISGQSGGVVCPGCVSRISGADIRPVSARILKYMRHFQRSSLQELMALNIPAEVKKGLEEVIQYYLTHTLESHLNSPDFINRIRE